MYANSIALSNPWPINRQTILHLSLILSLVVSLLAPLLELQTPFPSATVDPPTSVARNGFLMEAISPTSAPINAIPWRGYAEQVNQRDAFSRHYRLGDGRYGALISPTPQQYQAADGAWQPLDPRFVAAEDGYVVRQNSLISSLSGETSAALIQRDQQALGWLPQALVALNTTGEPIQTLAQPHHRAGATTANTNESPVETTLSADGTMLTYRHHWDDAALSETFVSGPGSLEQSLILVEPPALNSWRAALPFAEQPSGLALEAELYLLSGERLWANGELQTGSFSTAGSADQRLDLRTADGEISLSFAPVFAYEQADPTERVAGHYEGELIEPGVWRLRVVTPWAWWADPARQYPAVLDPQIYVEVLKPVAITARTNYEAILYEDGAAFAGLDDSEAPAELPMVAAGTQFLLNDNGLGERLIPSEESMMLPAADFATESDLVFNQLPVLPLASTISGTTLVLEGMLLGNEFWLEVVNPVNGSVLASHLLTVDEPLESCSEAGCDRHGSYAVNLTREIALPADQIAPLINAWYAGDNQGLRLRPKAGEWCDSLTSQRSGTGLKLECAFVSDNGIKLWIEYGAPPLNAGQRRSNQPLPSFDESYFGRSYHEYRTGDLPAEWTAVAVIGDAAVNQSVRVPINVLGKEVDLRTGSTINRTVNYVVLDNTNGQLPTPASALVDKRAENFAEGPIPDAHYDIQWQTPNAVALADPTPVWSSQVLNLSSFNLVNLLPFNVPAQHNLFVRVRSPEAQDIHVELFEPRPGVIDQSADPDLYGDYLAVRGESRHQAPPATEDGNGNLVYQIEGTVQSPFAQRWALVIAHDGVNKFCPGEPEGLVAAAGVAAVDQASCAAIQVTVETLACPAGEYATDRFGCQPILYPHEQTGGGVILPPGASTQEADAAMATVPRTATHDVGGVRIFSEGGFVGGPFGGAPDPGFYGGSYAVCTTGEEAGMPLLGLPSDPAPTLASQPPAERLIPVRQGSVCVTAAGDIEVVDPPRPGGGVYGAMVGPSIRENERRPVRYYNDEVDFYHGRIDLGGQFGTLDSGTMRQNDSNEFRLDPVGQVLTLMKPWEGWSGMLGIVSYIEIDQRAATGQQSGNITVVADDDKAEGIATVTVDSSWRRRAILPAPNYELEFDGAAQPPTLAIASLDLRFHAAGLPYLPPGSDKVSEIHLSDVTIHQRGEMGGAYRPVSAVIRKSGVKIREAQQSTTDADDNLLPCGATRSCLDVRSHDDLNRADWQMPDVDIAEETGSLIVQSAGNLQVFSNDHPDAGKLPVSAAGVNTPNAGQSFNFKAFKNEVVVEIGTCGEGENKIENATIVRGKGKISPPVIGSDGVTMFEAAYTLCENKLRHIHIAFSVFPPGVPIGSTGLVLSKLSGTVDVGPASTRVEMAVDFRTADGFTLTGGGATVVVDTAGYFSITGRAELVGKFDAQGTLAVAWNPLDVLQEASLGYEDWFEGFVRVHMWVGQGFGAKYHWLPDNNDVHFTGAIGAKLTLKKGRIGQFWKIKLPPVDIVFSVEVAFGEFCTNADCTEYEWGVQGKITVLKFSIGMYISRREVDFFVGNNGHTLIDSFAGAMAASISAEPLGAISDIGGGQTLDLGPVQPPCPTADGVATCTFPMPAGSGEAMFGVSWSDGTLPSATLRAPDGTLVAASEALAISDPTLGPGVTVYEQTVGAALVQFVAQPDGIFYTVQNPTVGDWVLTLTGLQGEENYNVLFAANTPPPALTLTTPNNTAVAGALDIQWQVTAGAEDATVNLGYVSAAEYHAYVAGIEAGEPITTVAGLRAGTPVGPPLAASQGNYAWAPSGLASGEYYIVARLDHPIHGASYSFSPGSFQYADTTPPAAPGSALLQAAPGEADGLIFSWDRLPDADLAAYEVVYSSPSLDTPDGRRERVLRINPTDPRLTHPTREQTRLVGLLEGIASDVCVRAVDASGNVGPCSATRTATPQPSGIPFWTTPDLTTLTTGPGRTLVAGWSAGVGSNGYLLNWGVGCAGTYYGPPADQGHTNLDMGAATSANLTGLPPGTYRAAVRGYQSVSELKAKIGTVGAFSNQLRTVLTDGIDGDGDGLPDDWATRYGVHGAGEDPDRDGVNNGLELIHATDPSEADSDRDGFSDGEELFSWATDACDPNSAPDPNSLLTLIVQPRDQVGDPTTTLRFDMPAGLNTGATQTIRVQAKGPGVLEWTAIPSHPWIIVQPTVGTNLTQFRVGDRITVGVDVTGLEPGYHEGHVRIQSLIGVPVHNAPQEVPVRLWVQRKSTIPQTRIEGYVFLDENGNGVEDGGETTRVEHVTVRAVNTMGGVMASVLSQTGSGVFNFSMLPFGSFSLESILPHPDYVVTTPNPLPVVLSAETPFLPGVKIGVMHNPPGPDNDGDGVPNERESLEGTDPNNPNSYLDSDGDRVPDYIEWRQGTDALKRNKYRDSDGDRVPDFIEQREGTDPNDATSYLDADGNGLADYTENLAPIVYTTRLYLPLVSK